MKRLTAALLALAAIAVLALPAQAGIGAGQHWKKHQLTFRKQATLGTYKGEIISGVDVPVIDSTYACLNGTAIDTTTAWTPTDWAPITGNAAVVSDSVTAFRVWVSALPGSAVDLNLPTVKIQGTLDGYNWFDELAATSTVAHTATAEQVCSYLWIPGSRAIGCTTFRFIIAGISGTTGCFQAFVTYPSTGE